ncbi:MAG: transcriptional repressor [Myxococcota bacterium]
MSVSEQQNNNTKTARSTIRDCGLRATSGRVAVLELLVARAVPMSHAEVSGALGGQWDRTTIYRNLVDLTEVGILHRSELGDRVWRFEVVSHAHDTTGHPHFVCIDCGLVECLTGYDLPTAPDGNVPQAVLHGDVEVTLRGQCDTCREV